MPRRIQSTPWQPFAAYNVCAARACHWCSYLNCTLHAYCCQALSRTRFDPHVAYPTHTHETLSSLVCRHTPMFTVSSLVRIAIVADALRSLLSVLRTSRMLPLALFFFWLRGHRLVQYFAYGLRACVARLGVRALHARGCRRVNSYPEWCSESFGPPHALRRRGNLTHLQKLLDQSYLQYRNTM